MAEELKVQNMRPRMRGTSELLFFQCGPLIKRTIFSETPTNSMRHRDTGGSILSMGSVISRELVCHRVA